MPYCEKCGTEISEEDKFCSNCGNSLNKSNSNNITSIKDKINSSEELSSIKDNINSENMDSLINKINTKNICLIVVVLFIILVGIFALGGSNDLVDVTRVE